MVFSDVDSCFAKEGANSPDNAGNIVVRKYEKRITWLDVDVKRPDSRQAGRSTRLCGSCDRDLLHPAAQPHFHTVRIVLRGSLRRREINATCFRYGAGVYEIETLLLYCP